MFAQPVPAAMAERRMTAVTARMTPRKKFNRENSL